jgi:hypothetical protein
MPVDALIALQASVTKTATFNGAALSLPGGTPRRGLKARVVYSAASTSSGTGSVNFALGVSYDGGTTWNDDFYIPAPIALSTTAASGEVYIPFDVSPTVVAGVITAPQIRLDLQAISGTGATITYAGDLSLTRP